MARDSTPPPGVLDRRVMASQWLCGQFVPEGPTGTLGWARCGLNDKHIFVAHVFINFYKDFTVIKAFNSGINQIDVHTPVQ